MRTKFGSRNYDRPPHLAPCCSGCRAHRAAGRRVGSVALNHVWDALESPVPVSTLLPHGHAFETLETLLTSGAIEYDNRSQNRAR